MKKIDDIKRKMCMNVYLNPKLDKKMLNVKKSFDEINKICNKKKK